MSSLNKVLIIGRLGGDPEARATPSGLTVSNFSVATNHKTKDGDEVQWHRVVMFDRLAEICNEYLAKGSLVYVEGRIKTHKYTDRDGIERYSTEIIGERMQMLGGRDDSQKQESNGGWGKSDGFESKGEAPGSYAKAKGGSAPASFDDLDIDTPF